MEGSPSVSVKSKICDYNKRLKRYRLIISGLRNGDVALTFLDHLSSLGLSVARICEYASHLPPLLRLINFDLAGATREGVEQVVAKINFDRKWSEWTCHDKNYRQSYGTENHLYTTILCFTIRPTNSPTVKGTTIGTVQANSAGTVINNIEITLHV